MTENGPAVAGQSHRCAAPTAVTYANLSQWWTCPGCRQPFRLCWRYTGDILGSPMEDKVVLLGVDEPWAETDNPLLVWLPGVREGAPAAP